MEKSNKGETWNESIVYEGNESITSETWNESTFYEGNESITSIKLVLNHDHLSFSKK